MWSSSSSPPLWRVRPVIASDSQPPPPPPPPPPRPASHHQQQIHARLWLSNLRAIKLCCCCCGPRNPQPRTSAVEERADGWASRFRHIASAPGLRNHRKTRATSCAIHDATIAGENSSKWKTDKPLLNERSARW
ncbi:hypothetical protein Y032_0016g2904 [Ancylostoma ceylanicum]|uniref:Uncharacterized protein n=1 Tax=Ancylostoma ceylanicum TaxID=53326 RepID=A0A016V4V1_9BILA|nr:hypothetical protein Y032_0016g2904 [Ancylostoma ceylanicum]